MIKSFDSNEIHFNLNYQNRNNFIFDGNIDGSGFNECILLHDNKWDSFNDKYVDFMNQMRKYMTIFSKNYLKQSIPRRTNLNNNLRQLTSFNFKNDTITILNGDKDLKIKEDGSIFQNLFEFIENGTMNDNEMIEGYTRVNNNFGKKKFIFDGYFTNYIISRINNQNKTNDFEKLFKNVHELFNSNYFIDLHYEYGVKLKILWNKYAKLFHINYNENKDGEYIFNMDTNFWNEIKTLKSHKNSNSSNNWKIFEKIAGDNKKNGIHIDTLNNITDVLIQLDDYLINYSQKDHLNNNIVDIIVINNIINNFFQVVKNKYNGFNVELIEYIVNKRIYKFNINGHLIDIPAKIFSIENIQKYIKYRGRPLSNNPNNKKLGELMILIKKQITQDYDSLMVLCMFKSLGDHLQAYYVYYINHHENKKLILTTIDRVLLATCLYTDTPCAYESSTLNFMKKLAENYIMKYVYQCVINHLLMRKKFQ